MVTSQNKEVLGVLDLVRKQKADSLKRLLATVDIVTEEEVICFWREAAVFKQTQEIVILAMNVAADLNHGSG